MEIRGTMSVDQIDVILDDGRRLILSSSGHVSVFASNASSNQYTIELPTFAEVSQVCPADGDGTFPIRARHPGGH